MKRRFLLILYILFPIVLFSQLNTNFSETDDSIEFYLENVTNWENSDRIKYEYNNQLKKYLENYLLTAPFDEPEIDSVNFLSVLKSDDKRIKVFTWLMTNQNGTTTHFGFVQKFEDNMVDSLYFLLDSKDENINHFFQQYSKDNWFGAIYYSIKTVEKSGSFYYVLLGYDPKDIHSNRKVIDVLSIDNSRNLLFGLPVFKQGKSYAYRVVFEFTERASMMLRYDEKYDMIIFDHLSPISNEYGGNPKFYGPDFSHDALKFEDGYWLLISDVDIRNPEVTKKDKQTHKYSW